MAHIISFACHKSSVRLVGHMLISEVSKRSNILTKVTYFLSKKYLGLEIKVSAFQTCSFSSSLSHYTMLSILDVLKPTCSPPPNGDFSISSYNYLYWFFL